MIGCPACGKSIPRDAVVCPYCARALSENLVLGKPAKKTSARILVLVVVALLVVWLLAKPSTPASEEILQVTASRGARGLQLINREPTAVNKCDVTLLDVGSTEWVASVPLSLAHLETTFVQWERFTSAGQPMPASIGQNRDRFIVSCVVDKDGIRRSNGFSF